MKEKNFDQKEFSFSQVIRNLGNKLLKISTALSLLELSTEKELS